MGDYELISKTVRLPSYLVDFINCCPGSNFSEKLKLILESASLSESFEEICNQTYEVLDDVNDLIDDFNRLKRLL